MRVRKDGMLRKVNKWREPLLIDQGLKKVVPGTPEGREPWNKQRPIYRPFREDDAGLAMENS